MARQKTIVDASVVVKFFVDEPGSQEAHSLRDAHIRNNIELVVPELIFLEVLNALRYKAANEEKLIMVCQDLIDIQFHVEKINKHILENAITAALNHRLSIYDAIYFSLAQLYGAELITADNELGKLPSVRLLGKK